MDIFAGVHVKAGVEEGAVAQALVCVTLNNLDKMELWTGFLAPVHLHALLLGGVGAELLDAASVLTLEGVHQRQLLCGWFTEQTEDFLLLGSLLPLLGRLEGQEGVQFFNVFALFFLYAFSLLFLWFRFRRDDLVAWVSLVFLLWLVEDHLLFQLLQRFPRGGAGLQGLDRFATPLHFIS